MTQAEVNAYNARRDPKRKRDESDYATNVGCAKESDLHEQIYAECRRRGWIALHGAMSERTHRTAGEPDFVILGSHPPKYDGDTGYAFVLFVECKSRTGKLSPEQSAMRHHAARLGHVIHVVRSFEEFIKICQC